MPLFGLPSQCEKLRDDDIKQLVWRRFLRAILRILSVFERRHEESKFFHVEYPSIDVASLGMFSGSEGVRESTPSRPRLLPGIPLKIAVFKDGLFLS